MQDQDAASSFIITTCVKDLPEEFREGAALEVQNLLAGLDDGEWSSDPVHLDVVLAASLAERAHLVESAYNGKVRPRSIHGTVGVRGLTISADARSPLRSTIVLDADYWTREDPRSVVVRFYLLLHEFMHVFQAAEMSDEEWAVSRAPAASVTECLQRDARYLWCEHDADVFADKAVRALTQGTGGPGSFLVDEFLACTRDLLAELSDPDIMRKGGTSLHAQKTARELFIVLAHLSAMWRTMGDEQELFLKVSALPGFHRTLGEDWKRLHAALALPSVDLASNEIAQVLRAALQRLGFVL